MKPTYEEFIELVEFLNDIENDEDIFIKLGRFFPELTAEQEIELGFIYENKDKDQYDKFMESDILYDPEGKSVPKDRQHWKLTLKLMDDIYTSLLISDINQNSKMQYMDAKDLTPLYSTVTSGNAPYTMSRVLFSKKYPNRLNDILDIEKYSNDLQLPDKFLRKLVAYLNKCKKESEFDIFLRTLKSRLYVLYMDKELEEESNQTFKETILAVVEY